MSSRSRTSSRVRSPRRSRRNRPSGPVAAASSSAASPPAKLVAPATRDVVAYDRFLKGRYFWNRRRLHESIAELEAAVERDPDFDEAYMALSEAWAAWGFYGGIPTWEAWARGRAAAERAEELAPDSASVPLCLGVLEHYYGWNIAREERLFRLAIARNPTSAEAHFWLGALPRRDGAPGRGSGGRARGRTSRASLAQQSRGRRLAANTWRAATKKPLPSSRQRSR